MSISLDNDADNNSEISTRDVTRIKSLERTNSDGCGTTYTVITGAGSGILAVNNSDGLGCDSHELLISPSANKGKLTSSSAVGLIEGIRSSGNSSFRVSQPLQSSSSTLMKPMNVEVPHSMESNMLNFEQGSGTFRRSCLASTPNLATICGVSAGMENSSQEILLTSVAGSGNVTHATLGRQPLVSIMQLYFST